MGKPRAKTKVYHKTPDSIVARRTGSTSTVGTPGFLYRFLDLRFRFQIDVCASAHNHKHEKYYSLERGENSLDLPWLERAFCNPPYGRRIPVFLAKGHAEAKAGKTLSVFLIPARTDTSWWHKYCWAATEIIEIEGRITFEGATHGAPFPSALIIFEPGKINLADGPKRTRFKLRDIKALMAQREKLVYLRPYTEEEAI